MKELGVVSGAGFGFAAICGASPAFAATSTGSISVTATVQATCSLTAAPLSFGSYTGSQLDASSAFSVSCTVATPYTIALDVGAGAGATTVTRKMSGPGAALNYTLYQDSARAAVWGQTTGTDTLANAGIGSVQTLNVYGRVAANQQPAPGSYTDTITATIAY
jgi:spore coat protein U-like protein